MPGEMIESFYGEKEAVEFENTESEKAKQSHLAGRPHHDIGQQRESWWCLTCGAQYPREEK